MQPSGYWQLFIQSFNPNRYERLLEYKLHEHLTFLLTTIGISLVLFTVLLLPSTYQYINNLPERIQPIERLEFTGNASANSSVVLLSNPSIILDLRENASDDADITLTNNGIFYPRYLLFGRNEISWNTIHDLKQQTQTRDRLLSTIVIFLLPSLIFWFSLYTLLKIAILSLLLFLLGFLLPRAFKHYISARDTMKIGILTLPSSVLFGLGLLPLAPILFWWGFGITAVLFGAGIALNSEIRLGQHKQILKHDPNKKV